MHNNNNNTRKNHTAFTLHTYILYKQKREWIKNYLKNFKMTLVYKFENTSLVSINKIINLHCRAVIARLIFHCSGWLHCWNIPAKLFILITAFVQYRFKSYLSKVKKHVLGMLIVKIKCNNITLIIHISVTYLYRKKKVQWTYTLAKGVDDKISRENLSKLIFYCSFFGFQIRNVRTMLWWATTTWIWIEFTKNMTSAAFVDFAASFK